MTSAAPELIEGPSPATALEQRYRAILGQQMRDMPMVNPALQVQAVGFRHWDQHWLGVLVTPWFMNLVLWPRVREHWPAVGERESRHYVFPAGVFEFIGSRDAELGDYQSCSLFSPMFEFAEQATAVATATAALEALFDIANRPASTIPPAQATAAPGSTPQPKSALSKRDFLFGSGPRSERGA